MGTNRYLIRPEVDSWILEHNGEAIESLATRGDALNMARTRAQREKGEVLVVDAEGRVESHERFGTSSSNDPVG
jgi:hypothetical protein